MCSRGFAPRFDEPLAGKTSFRLGGRAAVYAECGTADELVAAKRYAREKGLPFYILGAGTNVLVRDEGIRGVVIRLAGGEFAQMAFEGHEVVCGAAVPLAAVVKSAGDRGLGGIECLTGIPGTVGGAVRMNAGTREGAISDRVSEIIVLDERDCVTAMGPDQARFGYRSSALGQRIVLSARLALAPRNKAAIAADMERLLTARGASQPAGRSAGSVFRNPAIASAGALIEQSGLKGVRHGGARISPRHANWIIAGDGAGAHDVLTLIERCRKSVLECTGVLLETEICIWPGQNEKRSPI